MGKKTTEDNMSQNQRIEFVFRIDAFMEDMRLVTGKNNLHELEVFTGVDKSVLSRWQNGFTLPSLENFMKICARLNLHPHHYFQRQIWQLKDFTPEDVAPSSTQAGDLLVKIVQDDDE